MKYILVTGGAGFIGSNFIKYLNEKSHANIIVVDNVDDKNFNNLVDLKFEEIMTPQDLEGVDPSMVEAVIHQGAVSSTQAKDRVMDSNYYYTLALLNFFKDSKVPFIYASSASVYGVCNKPSKETDTLKPLNLYGFSKQMVDKQMLRAMGKVSCPVYGLRYFNVYGPREDHKGGQASPFTRFRNLMKNDETIYVLQGPDGFGGLAEDYRRDFVYVEDVCDVVYHFMSKNDLKQGIYNVGSGRASTFVEVADLVRKSIDHLKLRSSVIKPKEMPEEMKGKSQPFTQADLSKLREEGKYEREFLSIEDGYLKMIEELEGS